MCTGASAGPISDELQQFPGMLCSIAEPVAALVLGVALE